MLGLTFPCYKIEGMLVTSYYAMPRVREGTTHAGAMLGSITSMSSVTMRQACKPREEDRESETRRTVYGVVAHGVADLLDHALPANVLRVPGVRDDPAEFAVVVVDFPAVDSSADADVLRARSSVEVEGGDGMETHDVGVIGRKQALLPCVVEVAAVADGNCLRLGQRDPLC